jgi:hypothetical protein
MLVHKEKDPAGSFSFFAHMRRIIIIVIMGLFDYFSCPSFLFFFIFLFFVLQSGFASFGTLDSALLDI